MEEDKRDHFVIMSEHRQKQKHNVQKSETTKLSFFLRNVNDCYTTNYRSSPTPFILSIQLRVLMCTIMESSLPHLATLSLEKSFFFDFSHKLPNISFELSHSYKRSSNPMTNPPAPLTVRHHDSLRHVLLFAVVRINLTLAKVLCVTPWWSLAGGDLQSV